MKMPQTRPLIAFLTLMFGFVLIWDILHMPPNHDKTIAVQILSSITTILGMVLAYYFGATHKGTSTETNSNQKPTNKMSKQVFWDAPLDAIVYAIDSNTLADPCPVAELRTLDPAFEIVEDTTAQRVLTVETLTPISLDLGTVGIVTSVTADFIGGKPRRPI